MNGDDEVRFHRFSNFGIVQLLDQVYNIMLPDNFPVFHIDLDCDFESSDNVYPSFPKGPKHPQKTSSRTKLSRGETTSTFTAIGQRKDNLDRCVTLRRESFQLMALFDGHCDPQPVDFIAKELVSKLVDHPQLLTNPLVALAQAFEETERQVIEKFDKGSTALVALLIKEEIFVANLGDCKLTGVDLCGNVKDFTTCHNLSNPEELKEVISRGGLVLKKGTQYRINGELNLSRCIGDRHLKYCVSSQPDLYRFNIGESKRWILSTDGFYNAQSLDKRLKVNNYNDLLEMKTVYKDNASAIFFDA